MIFHAVQAQFFYIGGTTVRQGEGAFSDKFLGVTLMREGFGPMLPRAGRPLYVSGNVRFYSVVTQPELGRDVAQTNIPKGGAVRQQGFDSNLSTSNTFPRSNRGFVLLDAFLQDVMPILPGITPRIIRQDFEIAVSIAPKLKIMSEIIYHHLRTWLITASGRDVRTLRSIIQSPEVNSNAMTELDLIRRTSRELAAAINTLVATRMKYARYRAFRDELPLLDCVIPKWIYRIFEYIEAAQYSHVEQRTLGTIRSSIKYLYQGQPFGSQSYYRLTNIENAIFLINRIFSLTLKGYEQVNLMEVLPGVNSVVGYANCSIDIHSYAGTLDADGERIEEPNYVGQAKATPKSSIVDTKDESKALTAPKDVEDAKKLSNFDLDIYPCREALPNARLDVELSFRSTSDDLLFALFWGISVDVKSSLGTNLRPKQIHSYLLSDVKPLLIQWGGQQMFGVGEFPAVGVTSYGNVTADGNKPVNTEERMTMAPNSRNNNASHSTKEFSGGTEGSGGSELEGNSSQPRKGKTGKRKKSK